MQNNRQQFSHLIEFQNRMSLIPERESCLSRGVPSHPDLSLGADFRTRKKEVKQDHAVTMVPPFASGELTSQFLSSRNRTRSRNLHGDTLPELSGGPKPTLLKMLLKRKQPAQLNAPSSHGSALLAKLSSTLPSPPTTFPKTTWREILAATQQLDASKLCSQTSPSVVFNDVVPRASDRLHIARDFIVPEAYRNPQVLAMYATQRRQNDEGKKGKCGRNLVKKSRSRSPPKEMTVKPVRSLRHTPFSLTEKYKMYSSSSHYLQTTRAFDPLITVPPRKPPQQGGALVCSPEDCPGYVDQSGKSSATEMGNRVSQFDEKTTRIYVDFDTPDACPSTVNSASLRRSLNEMEKFSAHTLDCTRLGRSVSWQGKTAPVPEQKCRSQCLCKSCAVSRCLPRVLQQDRSSSPSISPTTSRSCRRCDWRNRGSEKNVVSRSSLVKEREDNKQCDDREPPCLRVKSQDSSKQRSEPPQDSYISKIRSKSSHVKNREDNKQCDEREPPCLRVKSPDSFKHRSEPPQDSHISKTRSKSSDVKNREDNKQCDEREPPYLRVKSPDSFKHRSEPPQDSYISKTRSKSSHVKNREDNKQCDEREPPCLRVKSPAQDSYISKIRSKNTARTERRTNFAAKVALGNSKRTHSECDCCDCRMKRQSEELLCIEDLGSEKWTESQTSEASKRKRRRLEQNQQKCSSNLDEKSATGKEDAMVRVAVPTKPPRKHSLSRERDERGPVDVQKESAGSVSSSCPRVSEATIHYECGCTRTGHVRVTKSRGSVGKKSLEFSKSLGIENCDKTLAPRYKTCTLSTCSLQIPPEEQSSTNKQNVVGSCKSIAAEPTSQNQMVDDVDSLKFTSAKDGSTQTALLTSQSPEQLCVGLEETTKEDCIEYSENDDKSSSPFKPKKPGNLDEEIPIPQQPANAITIPEGYTLVLKSEAQKNPRHRSKDKSKERKRPSCCGGKMKVSSPYMNTQNNCAPEEDSNANSSKRKDRRAFKSDATVLQLHSAVSPIQSAGLPAGNSVAENVALDLSNVSSLPKEATSTLKQSARSTVSFPKEEETPVAQTSKQTPDRPQKERRSDPFGFLKKRPVLPKSPCACDQRVMGYCRDKTYCSCAEKIRGTSKSMQALFAEIAAAREACQQNSDDDNVLVGVTVTPVYQAIEPHDDRLCNRCARRKPRVPLKPREHLEVRPLRRTDSFHHDCWDDVVEPSDVQKWRGVYGERIYYPRESSKRTSRDHEEMRRRNKIASNRCRRVERRHNHDPCEDDERRERGSSSRSHRHHHRPDEDDERPERECSSRPHRRRHHEHSRESSWEECPIRRERHQQYHLGVEHSSKESRRAERRKAYPRPTVTVVRKPMKPVRRRDVYAKRQRGGDDCSRSGDYVKRVVHLSESCSSLFSYDTYSMNYPSFGTLAESHLPSDEEPCISWLTLVDQESQDEKRETTRPSDSEARFDAFIHD